MYNSESNSCINPKVYDDYSLVVSYRTKGGRQMYNGAQAKSELEFDQPRSEVYLDIRLLDGINGVALH